MCVRAKMNKNKYFLTSKLVFILIKLSYYEHLGSGEMARKITRINGLSRMAHLRSKIIYRKTNARASIQIIQYSSIL